MRRLTLVLLFTILAGCPRDPEPQSTGTQPTPAVASPVERPVEVPPAPPPAADSPLLHPERFTEQAPPAYAVELVTSKGTVTIDVTRAWAPNAADRFYNLVKGGYFHDVAFFRVIEGFMAQVGMHGDPVVNRAWERAGIPDEPVVQHNTRGMVTFAQTSAPNSRTTQFFINFGDNSQLDGMGFAPFGRVRDMSIVDRLHAGYGEGAPSGAGPAQGRIASEGNSYLRSSFPNLDYIVTARILP